MSSSCCWERVIDPWNTWEWLCSSCLEHCTDEPEEEVNIETKIIDRQIDMFRDMMKQFSFKI
jgi:hypothetical protein